MDSDILTAKSSEELATKQKSDLLYIEQVATNQYGLASVVYSYTGFKSQCLSMFYSKRVAIDGLPVRVWSQSSSPVV